jgi:hypothetical protein
MGLSRARRSCWTREVEDFGIVVAGYERKKREDRRGRDGRKVGKLRRRTRYK